MKKQNKPENPFTHINQDGNARMVNVGHKIILARTAVASGFIRMSPIAVKAVEGNNIKKGDVLSVAQIAGIQAAKQTPTLIPLCHSLLLDSVSITFEITKAGIGCKCTVKCQGKTGVEMEALTGTTVALLTIYDMCKAIDKKMVIDEIKLIKKEKMEIENEKPG